MISTKNKGPKLFYSRFGGEQPIPPEFIAAMERKEEVQPVPNDVEPEDLSDTIIESETKTDRTNERVRRTVKKKPGNVGPLLTIHTDEHGRPVQVSRLLYPTGSTLTAYPNAYTTVAVHDLGNEWSIEEIGVEGTYIGGTFTPSIFQGLGVTTKSARLIPSEFDVANVVTTHYDVDGAASLPDYTADFIELTQEQIAQNKNRITTVVQGLPTIPTINALHRDTNNAKQVVIETHTFLNDADTVKIPDVLTDIKVIQHGDGRKTEIKREVTELFLEKVYSAEVPDNIPTEFHTQNSTKTTETLVEGLAGPVSLSTHEIARSEAQVNEFVFRRKATTRVTTLGVTITEDRLDGISDGHGSFFDGIVTKSKTLSAGPVTADETLLTIDSTIKALGGTPDFPAGVFLKETSLIANYPTLSGSQVDQETGVRTAIVKGIVAPNATPGAYVSQLPLNRTRSLQIAETIDATALLAVGFVLPGTTNVDLPPQLLSVTGYMASTQQAGFYSETGAYTLQGQGSGGISLHGSATGASAVIPEADYQVKQIWGNDVPCIHYLFYLANPATSAQVLTRLGVLAGTSVLSWPLFAPKPLSIVLVGQRVTGTAQVGASASDSIHTDYTGAIIHAGSIRTSGDGVSLEVDTTVKVLRLPPTIHGALTITNASGLSGVVATCAISNGATASSRAVAASAIGAIVNAANNLATIPATFASAGFLNTLPTSGLYLHRVQSEPYKYGYVKIHAEVVDFGVINPPSIS